MKHYSEGYQESENFKGPEVLRSEHIAGAVKTFKESLADFSYQGTVGDLKERRSAWHEFLSKTIEPAGQRYLQEMRSADAGEDALARIQTIFGGARVIERALDERLGKEFGQETKEQGKERVLREAAWQQQMAWLILRHRTMRQLSDLMNNFWSSLNRVGNAIVEGEGYMEKRERGIERLVTAVQIFEDAGWKMSRVKAEKDVEEGVDTEGIRALPDGRRLIVAVQVKPSSLESEGEGAIEIFYPLPAESEAPENVWSLVRSVRKRTEQDPGIPILPIRINMPSSRERPEKIAHGTGLFKTPSLASESVLDKKSQERLNTIETLLGQPQSFKLKKRRIYVPNK